MKVKVRPLGIKPNVGWAVEYINQEGIQVEEVFNEHYQAEERACRLDSVQHDRLLAVNAGLVDALQEIRNHAVMTLSGLANKHSRAGGVWGALIETADKALAKAQATE